MTRSDFKKMALVYANPGEWISTGQAEEPGWIGRHCNYLDGSLNQERSYHLSGHKQRCGGRAV